MTKRIYLAGKVKRHGWRESLVSGLHDYFTASDFEQGFPVLPIYGFNAVSTGPVPIACDHGCFHGNNSHGAGLRPYTDDHGHPPIYWPDGGSSEPGYGCQSGGVFLSRAKVQLLCEMAIVQSDAVFAWIDDKTCFGTLVEIGYAYAHGRPIYLAAPPAFVHSGLDELWFAVEAAKARCFTEDTARAAFEVLFAEWRHQDLRTMPYQEYLQTDHWKTVRNQAREAAGHRCQLCNSPHYLHVHHRTYERRGAELPSDLIVLCAPCHSKFHAKLPTVGV